MRVFMMRTVNPALRHGCRRGATTTFAYLTGEAIVTAVARILKCLAFVADFLRIT